MIMFTGIFLALFMSILAILCVGLLGLLDVMFNPMTVHRTRLTSSILEKPMPVRCDGSARLATGSLEMWSPIRGANGDLKLSIDTTDNHRGDVARAA